MAKRKGSWLRPQYWSMRGHVDFLRRERIARGPLVLAACAYPGRPETRRVSLVGNTISLAMLEIWRAQGLRVHIVWRSEA